MFKLQTSNTILSLLPIPALHLYPLSFNTPLLSTFPNFNITNPNFPPPHFPFPIPIPIPIPIPLSRVFRFGEFSQFDPKMVRGHDQHHHSRVLYELSSLILNILRSPLSPPLHFSDHVPSPSPSSSRRRSPAISHQITAAGFASLMLGISLTLMLCGSVTFFIGFMLLPWVIGLVLVFYFVGFVSTLSVLVRAFLCYATSPSSSPGYSSVEAFVKMKGNIQGGILQPQGRWAP